MQQIKKCLLFLFGSVLHCTVVGLICKMDGNGSLDVGGLIKNKEIFADSQTCRIVMNATSNLTVISFWAFEWYSLEDHEGIGLNMSWSISLHEAVGFFGGFHIEIEKQRSKVHEIDLCLNYTLGDGNVTFHYDGFIQARPDSIYTAYISTISGNNNNTKSNNTVHHKLSVPSCLRNTCLQNTKACVNLSIVGEFDCTNRFFQLPYYIPSYLFMEQNNVFLWLCENKPPSNNCVPPSNDIVFPVQEHLPQSGVRNITLPKELLSSNKTYSIQIRVKHRHEINVTALYKHCLATEWNFPIVVIVLLSVCLFVTVFFLVLYFKAGRKLKVIASWLPCMLNDAPRVIPDPSLNCPLKLYLLYVDDHDKHRDVLLKFASFLKCDLNFDVMFELYSQGDIYADSESWMEKNLHDADKIVFVWSPRAATRWRKRDSENIENDMFTPVMRKIYSNSRDASDQNVESINYFSVYFDYCDEQIIPNDFKTFPFLPFQLMQDFENLYFQIHGIKCNVNGNKLHDERVAFGSYFNSTINSHGQVLCDSIRTMQNLVEENPDWYVSPNDSQQNECNNFIATQV